MPPRRAPARGAAATRGASNVAPDADATDAKVKVENTAAEPMDAEPQIKADPGAFNESAPQENAAPVANMAPTANMGGTPVSAGSGTPAPPPAGRGRPAPQRLASLSTRGARGGAAGPPARGALRGRGSIRGRGGASAASTPAPESSADGATFVSPAPVAKKKFAPRVVQRKTAEQREAAAAEEAARIAAAEHRENAGKGRGRGRGRGRGGRGRGDAMGMGDRVISGTATGVFSQLAGGGARRAGLSHGGGGGGGGGGYSGGGSRLGGGTGGMGHYNRPNTFNAGEGGNDYNFPVYPEEINNPDGVSPRMDIEQINLVSDDEADVVITGSRPLKQKKPIRLMRHEHKERVMLVNTDSSADTDATAIKADPDAEHETDPDSSLFVKDDHDDTMDLDAIPQKNSRMSIGSIDLDAPIPQPLTADEVAARREGKKPAASKAKIAKRPVLETEEDKAEYLRQQEDIQILSNELAGLQTKSTDADGNVEMEEGAEKKDLEGRVYLFQFPPILPRLRNEPSPELKGSGEDDIEMADIPANGTPIEIPDDVKPEPGVEVDPANPNHKPPPPPLVNEEGKIGHMIVRKSGKVAFSWGGTSLALGRGAPFDFLAKGVIVHGLQKPDPHPSRHGRDVTKEEELSMSGTGMGKIMGKFVATPDWEKLFKPT